MKQEGSHDHVVTVFLIMLGVVIGGATVIGLLLWILVSIVTAL